MDIDEIVDVIEIQKVIVIEIEIEIEIVLIVILLNMIKIRT